MKLTIQNYEDPGTVLLNRDEIDALTRGNIIDAPITRLKQNPDVWLLPTAMQQNGDVFLSHTLVRGDLDQLESAEFCVVNEHLLFDTPEHLANQNNGRHWITNLLHVEGGVLAFLHSEYTGQDDFFGMATHIIDGAETKAPGRSSIGLAWLSAEDLAADQFTFTYLGHIATYSANFPHYNVSGTPVLVNQIDGVEYVNIMFMDAKGSRTSDGWDKDAAFVAQARAPLELVVEKAKSGELAQWQKRSGSDWSDAMGRRSSSALPRVPGHPDKRIRMGDVIVHSDAAFVERLGKYVLLAYVLKRKNRLPTALVLYTSDDGLEWEYSGTEHERTDGEAGWSYASFFDVNDDGKPYVIIGWDYGKPGRRVYKLEVDFNGEE